MGTAPLGAKLCRRIAEAVGEPIKRAVGSGGYDFEFVTFDHRHGFWSKRTGLVTWPTTDLYPTWCWSSCAFNFPDDSSHPAPVPEHLCGARHTFDPVTRPLDAVCAEPAGHYPATRHRCGSLQWENTYAQEVTSA